MPYSGNIGKTKMTVSKIASEEFVAVKKALKASQDVRESSKKFPLRYETKNGISFGKS